MSATLTYTLRARDRAKNHSLDIRHCIRDDEPELAAGCYGYGPRTRVLLNSDTCSR